MNRKKNKVKLIEKHHHNINKEIIFLNIIISCILLIKLYNYLIILN